LDREFGLAALQHAKDLIWVSVKPLLSIFHACSSDVVPVDPSIVIPTPVISVFGNSDITRHIAMFLQRRDNISIDPDDDDEEQEPDEVKKRVEATLVLVTLIVLVRATKRLAPHEVSWGARIVIIRGERGEARRRP
jgi:hypothetical protein